MLKYNFEVLEQECKNCDFFVEGDNFGFRVYTLRKGVELLQKALVQTTYYLF